MSTPLRPRPSRIDLRAAWPVVLAEMIALQRHGEGQLSIEVRSEEDVVFACLIRPQTESVSVIKDTGEVEHILPGTQGLTTLGVHVKGNTRETEQAILDRLGLRG